MLLFEAIRACTLIYQKENGFPPWNVVMMPFHLSALKMSFNVTTIFVRMGQSVSGQFTTTIANACLAIQGHVLKEDLWTFVQEILVNMEQPVLAWITILFANVPMGSQEPSVRRV